jgi:hypothetical protein
MLSMFASTNAGTFARSVTDQGALRYAMSGVDSLEVLHQNLGVASGFMPLSEQQMQTLRDRCASAAADGDLELYRSTKKFGGEVGRLVHGYPTPQQLPL